MIDIASRFREYIRLERKRDTEGLSPAELDRWNTLKRLLNKRFSPGLSDEAADRRRSVRVPTRLTVTFRDEQELRSSLMTNLSRGGVFISTERPAEIGTVLELRIDLTHSGETIDVPAEVVSVNVGPEMRTSRPGMGVRFRPTSEEMQKKLDQLYEYELKEAAIRGS
jgi:uncharacterized protein (TIGR02266 family)